MNKRKNVAGTNRDEPTIWNQAMDNALIDAFVYQHQIGNRVNGTFTSKAYDNILKEISAKFPGKKFDKERIKNRIKYIKRGFGSCFDIFKNGLSGFSWNAETNMWCAEPEVWDKLVEVHPDAAQWRDKPIHNYEKLILLYGVDRATGEEAETSREIRDRTRKEQEKNHDAVTIEEIDRMVFNDEVRLEDYNTPINIHTPPLQSQGEGTSSGKRKRRRVTKDEDIDSMKEAFQAVADAITKAATELVKSQEGCQVSKSEIWKLLEEFDFDEHLMDKAYIFLLKNPNMLDGLLNCPSNRRRNLLLEMMK